MRKRTRYSLLLMLALIAALAVAVYLRQKAPPEVARLLPESDAIVYANVRPLRLATHFDRTAVKRSPEFQRFIDATGVVPERDLDEVAFALHRMDDPRGPNGPVAYSEVFSGRFDGDRLGRYLASIATARESYAGHTIYTIPVGDAATGGGRELRVTQLGYDMVAASNMPTVEQIHSILDRYRAAASPFAGSSLLSARYGDIPLLSSAWGIGHVGLPFSEGGRITVLGLQLPLPEDTTFVASLQYRGSVRMRVEQIAPTPEDAARSVEALSTLLGMFRSIQRVQQGAPADAAMAQAIDSLKIERKDDRAVLTANIPMDMLKQLTTPARSADDTNGLR
ncbi:hypothetical protein [Granulicella sp. dw_53]|uniref:hypothetical protein n=1 Tax=Granulicella sp. dw_53 TaxID=2719792 RepID=UPI001BD6C074|nr:hypothetical protein [Granulicella sp. dw_53]